MKTTIIVAIIALVLAGTASATSFSQRQLSDARVGTSRRELIAQRDRSNQVLRFFQRHHWMAAPRHADCWSHVPWHRTCIVARNQIKLHNWLYDLSTDRLKRLYPTSSIPRWLVDAFLCIHRFEGSWTSNTGNGYYGGMQMDRRFMATYGGEYLLLWGTADNWPVWAQLEASARGYAARGFSPWPNTARACGLL